MPLNQLFLLFLSEGLTQNTWVLHTAIFLLCKLYKNFKISSIAVLIVFSLWQKGILGDFYNPSNSPDLIIYKKLSGKYTKEQKIT